MLWSPELPMIQLREVDFERTEQGLVGAVCARFEQILSAKGRENNHTGVRLSGRCLDRMSFGVCDSHGDWSEMRKVPFSRY